MKEGDFKNLQKGFEKNFPEDDKDQEKKIDHEKFVKMIEKTIDDLLKERRDLHQKLDEMNTGIYCLDAFYEEDMIPDELIFKIRDNWLSRVRKETDFLSFTDSLGIEIFNDNLMIQPNFSGTVRWNHDFRNDRRWIGKRNLPGGDFNPNPSEGEPEIRIAGQNPNIRKQLVYFAIKGEIHPVVEVFIHEFIHKIHYNNKKDKMVSSELTEAQAHFSGIIGKGSSFSMLSRIKILSSDDGLYSFDNDKVIKALTAISALYALGASQEEISDLVIASEYSEEKDAFLPIEDEIQETVDRFNLDDLDLQLLEDIYKVNSKNNLLKAQLMLIESFIDLIPMEDLIELKKKRIKNGLAVPPYYEFEGLKHNPNSFLQNMVCPINEEFPYEPGGDRTGIIFGYFAEPDKAADFCVGKCSIKGNKVNSELAYSEEEVEYYLKVIADNSKNISLGHKEFFLARNLEFPGLKNGSLRDKVIKSLVSNEEARDLITSDFIEEFLIRLYNNLDLVTPDNSSGFCPKISDEQINSIIGAFINNFENLSTLLDMYNLDIYNIYKKTDVIKEILERKLNEFSGKLSTNQSTRRLN